VFFVASKVFWMFLSPVGLGARGRVVVWRPLAANIPLNRDRSGPHPHHPRDDATRADGRRALGEPLSTTGGRHHAALRDHRSGGAVNGPVSKARGEIVFDEGERMIEAAFLAKRRPE
jgi:hypothetical protein